MLTKADNELICRVGPGTGMGEVMRRYWMPILLEEELPEPDGAPVRVRLLGEDLVAWRNTDGSVGMMQNACPHRGASMFFGRNEENGLRCVYHGWKFDNEGNCVDMPNEPAESNFKHKIHAAAYPTHIQGGVVWTYMGPADTMPAPPAYEWSRLPKGHMHISKTFEDCNWLQALEGGIDSSHSSFLHRNLGDNDPTLGRGSYRARSTAPRLEVLYTPWGYTYASIRHIADENVNYVRCYQYVMPFQQQRAGFVGMGPRKTEGVHGHVWVPIDDTHTFVFNFLYARDGRALDPDDVYKMEHNAGRAAEDYISGTYFLNRNRANDWLIDREVQKKVNYSGIMGVNTQDMALQETMGGIYDRTKEHLGSADSAIIAARRLLMKAIKDVQAGLPPAGSRGEGDTIRPVEETIPVNIPWAEHFKQGLVSAL